MKSVDITPIPPIKPYELPREKKQRRDDSGNADSKREKPKQDDHDDDKGYVDEYV